METCRGRGCGAGVGLEYERELRTAKEQYAMAHCCNGVEHRTALSRVR